MLRCTASLLSLGSAIQRMFPYTRKPHTKQITVAIKMAGQMAANAIEKVSETFSFAKKIPMLMKATSDDDNPTSGYIYQEINSITYESISSCNSLLDFLVGRLKKQSPNIKYKVLKILCYVASNGHSEFRSALRHKAGIVREAESFTGQMDYLRGDSLNQQVRAAASELIELLFNVESCGSSNMHAMTGPTGKKMEGFGNSPSQPAKNKTWLDSVKNLAEHFPDTSSRLTSKSEKEHVPTTGGSGITFVNYSEFSNVNSAFKTFLDGEDSYQSTEDQESGEPESTLSVEGHLVDNITSEGGIRAVPSKEALNQFTKRCSSLNIIKVLEALNNRLLEPVTDVQLKSLHVLEHLLKSDIPGVASKMSHQCTNLQEITKTESGNLLSKAKKITLLINAKVEKEKAQKDVHTTSEVDSAELLNIQNVGDTENFSAQQFAVDDTPTLFSGMSLHSHSGTTTRSQPFVSYATISERRPSEKAFDVFQGLDLSGRNHTPKTENEYSSRQTFHSSKLELGDLFSVTTENAGPTFASQGQEPVKDSVTDLFDPLCNNSASSFGTYVTQPCVTLTVGPGKERFSNSKTNSETGPQLLSCGNSLISPQGNALPPVSSANESSVSSGLDGLCALGDLDNVSHNRTSQPQVALPNTGLPIANRYSSNSPNNSHPALQLSVLSGSSTIPLRLPKQPSQRTDFSFVGKSGKADAFSFVQEEMKARK